jgi:deoxyribodipyrimidine photo-lyase
VKLVWFRNDLRVVDNHALFNACEKANACAKAEASGVMAVAVITPQQWMLQDESKARVQFWLANLHSLKEELSSLNIPLKVIYTDTNEHISHELLALAEQYAITDLYFNREYPEYEMIRDKQVESALLTKGINCHSFDSDTVLPPGSVLSLKGEPYRVFTPFSRAWRKRYLMLMPELLRAPNKQVELSIVSDSIPTKVASHQVGADWKMHLWPAGTDQAHKRLKQFVTEKHDSYLQQRDFPQLQANSGLSPYLNTGVLSVRQCLAALQSYSDDPEWFQQQWVTELIWREFYRHILVQWPELNRWEPFKPEIEDKLAWPYNEELFQAWFKGETGFAIIDAGMKELLETGFMHNRVRMVCASFLTKLLRQDWRLGARFFMQHLVDGDFASNLGGWQWSASVGADAAPYFRIFNPLRQAERFDKAGVYCSTWIPELKGLNSLKQHDPMYSVPLGLPSPIIDYANERKVSLALYSSRG